MKNDYNYSPVVESCQKLDEKDTASQPWPIANIHGMRSWAMFVVTATALVETNVTVKIDLPVGTLMWRVGPEVCD